MKITLSALDQSPVPAGSTPREALQNTVRLAQELEKLDYHRFWVSEHHDSASLAGSSPEVLISHIAAKTEKIRVGSGGVMLPHYSAYKVAENFRLLEALYPNRIDVGLGRAPGGMPIATMALQKGKTSRIDDYPEQVADLIGYLNDSLPRSHQFSGLKASPIIDTVPEVHLLGSSGGSARIAAELGTPFAYAQFINGESGAVIMRGYQDNFKPSIVNEKPQSIVAIFVICAETEKEANRVASSLDLTLLALGKGQAQPLVAPEEALKYPYSSSDLYYMNENRKRMIVGNPEQVKQRILQMSEEYNTTEFMIVTLTHDFEDKLQSYKLIAEALS